MKKLKTFATMFAAVAAMLLLPGVFSLKASAEEYATYYFEYDPDPDSFGWYVLTEDDLADREHAEHKVLDFFYLSARESDIAVAAVVSCYDENAPLLDLGEAHLGNVTVLSDSAFCMIKAARIDDFFALAGSSSSITAPITTAYVYDPCLVNFNDDVHEIILTADKSAANTTMGSGATVDSLQVCFTSNNTSYTLYNFKRGTFFFENGYVTTDTRNFNRIPPAELPTPDPIPAGGYKLKDLFDANYYADRYPDLKLVFGYNSEALWTHFSNNGLNEGRVMNGLLDVVKYRRTYADLNNAFGDNWDLYVNHYLTAGALEGRDSGTDFHVQSYLTEYPDLQRVYENNVMALWKYYNTTGKWAN